MLRSNNLKLVEMTDLLSVAEKVQRIGLYLSGIEGYASPNLEAARTCARSAYTELAKICWTSPPQAAGDQQVEQKRP